MPQPSQGPKPYPVSELPPLVEGLDDVEIAFGGADAVPETPDASPSGASLDGPTEAERAHGIMAMRQYIRAGRVALFVLSAVFVIGLAGWVFWFFYW